MALYLTHKINQGAHIRGRGQSLDLIVRSVQGSYDCCEAELEVRSQEGSKIINIKKDDPPLLIMEEFNIALVEKRARNAVNVAYSADWDYQIRRKDYR